MRRTKIPTRGCNYPRLTLHPSHEINNRPPAAPFWLLDPFGENLVAIRKRWISWFSVSGRSVYPFCFPRPLLLSMSGPPPRLDNPMKHILDLTDRIYDEFVY